LIDVRRRIERVLGAERISPELRKERFSPNRFRQREMARISIAAVARNAHATGARAASAIAIIDGWLVIRKAQRALKIANPARQASTWRRIPARTASVAQTRESAKFFRPSADRGAIVSGPDDDGDAGAEG
jgi:hypothetical protein